MRSGIGQAPELSRLSIDAILDAPEVGQNLCEPPLIWMTIHLLPESRSSSVHVRWGNCYVRYSSGLAGAGPNDMIFNCVNMSPFAENQLS